MNANRRKKIAELKVQDPTLTGKQCYEMTKGIKGKRKNVG